MKNKIVPSMALVDMSDVRLPMIVICKQPADFPGDYTARLFDANIPTNIMIKRKAISDVREDIAAAGFAAMIPRMYGDDKCIVETWMM